MSCFRRDRAGAPVNFFNVNAVMRRFMERLVCFAYWRWDMMGPQVRTKQQRSRAVLSPEWPCRHSWGRFFTGALRALKITAKTLGAKPVASIVVGMIARSEHPLAPAKAMRKARAAASGRPLAWLLTEIARRVEPQ